MLKICDFDATTYIRSLWVRVSMLHRKIYLAMLIIGTIVISGCSTTEKSTMRPTEIPANEEKLAVIEPELLKRAICTEKNKHSIV